MTIQGRRITIFANQEADDGFIRKDRLGRDAHRRRRGDNTLLDAVRAGALLAQDARHKVCSRLSVEHFRNFVANDLGIATALAASAKLGRARDDLVYPFQMRGQLVAARVILVTSPLLVGRAVALGRFR